MRFLNRNLAQLRYTPAIFRRGVAMRGSKSFNRRWTSALIALAIFDISASASAARAPALKYDTEINLARQIMASNPRAALEHARKAQDLVDTSQPPKDQHIAQLTAKWLEISALDRLNSDREAAPFAERLLEDAQTYAPNTVLQAQISQAVAGVYEGIGDVQRALIQYQKAYRLYQGLNQPRSEAVVLEDIGVLYLNAHDYDRVVKYYNQAMEIYPDDLALELSRHNNIALAYMDTNRLEDAIKEFQASLVFAKKLNSAFIQAQILNNIAGCDLLLNRLSDADKAITTGLKLTSRPDAAEEKRFLLGELAIRREKSGDLEGAKALIDETFRGVDLTHTDNDYLFSHKAAVRIYKRLGDFRTSMAHLEAQKRLEDAARELAASTNAALMSAQFDFANQDLKIARLKTEEMRKSAELSRSREQARLGIGLVLAASGLVILAVLTYGFFYMRRSRNTVRAINTELQTSNAHLEKALKAKTEFLASTSHEIRTPLNGILGTTEVLLHDRSIESSIRERLKVVMDAGQTMRAMVDDLLDLAKAETGVISVARNNIDLHQTILGAIDTWRDQATAKGLTLTASLEGAPPHIYEDGDRLRQIVLNLVSNAIKFTDKGFVHVKVDLDPTGTRLRIAVSDSGIGIAPADQAYVFDSFTQVETGLSRRFAGAGLGLAICRQIADALNGKIDLESTQGKGSTFTMEIPVQRPKDDSAHALIANLEPPAETTNYRRILILEKNPLSQSMVRAMIGKTVQSLVFTNTLGDFLDQLALEEFDAILCDWATLYQSDGVETPSQFLAKLGKTDPVVIINAPDEDTERDALNLNPSAILRKPLQKQALNAALTAAMAHMEPQVLGPKENLAV